MARYGDYFGEGPSFLWARIEEDSRTDTSDASRVQLKDGLSSYSPCLNYLKGRNPLCILRLDAVSWTYPELTHRDHICLPYPYSKASWHEHSLQLTLLMTAPHWIRAQNQSFLILLIGQFVEFECPKMIWAIFYDTFVIIYRLLTGSWWYWAFHVLVLLAKSPFHLFLEPWFVSFKKAAHIRK